MLSTSNCLREAKGLADKYNILQVSHKSQEIILSCYFNFPLARSLSVCFHSPEAADRQFSLALEAGVGARNMVSLWRIRLDIKEHPEMQSHHDETTEEKLS